LRYKQPGNADRNRVLDVEKIKVVILLYAHSLMIDMC